MPQLNYTDAGSVKTYGSVNVGYMVCFIVISVIIVMGLDLLARIFL